MFYQRDTHCVSDYEEHAAVARVFHREQNFGLGLRKGFGTPLLTLMINNRATTPKRGRPRFARFVSFVTYLTDNVPCSVETGLVSPVAII